MTPLLQSTPPPTLFRDLEVQAEDASSILRAQKDPLYGFTFGLSPYRGCSHGCTYCYVRDYPARNPAAGPGALHDPADWGRWVAPKLNAPALLWAQRHRLHQQTVFLSSATDPYQPLEREFRLTRGCLEVLLQCPSTKVMLLTRSPLILQDVDLLRAFGSRLSVGLSIPTDDDTVRQITEPPAPPIPSRWATLERLSKAGLQTGVAVAPLMPVHDLQAFIRRARASGATSAWVGGLRLLAKDPFHKTLADHGWLKVLDPSYVTEVRDAFRQAFPRGERSTRTPKRGEGAHLQPPPPMVRQPGLFDAAV